MNNAIPETINYHFISNCNMACKFCFAEHRSSKKFTLDQHKAVIQALGEVKTCKPRRLNFVGGEPTVYPYLTELIHKAYLSGLRTSIVTNGFNIIKNGIPQEFEYLDLIGVSIDSLDHNTNIKIGRSHNGVTISEADWQTLFYQIASMDIRLKINTTISQYNLLEDLSTFIFKANPLRWKVFQAIVIEGENDLNQDDWKVNKKQFESFINRHRSNGLPLVTENKSEMTGSYAMISPDGKFFDNVKGSYTYSDPILEVGVEEAWKQINFDLSKYQIRTSSYNREENHVSC